MAPGSPVTQIIILAEATLARAAWEALLSGQQAIAIWGTAAGLDDVRVLPTTNSQTTVLVDSRDPQPLYVNQLAGAVPSYGRLYLVDEYDLGQIMALLQAGASGALSRDATVPELVRGLVAAGREEIVLPPSLAARALAALARGEVHPQRGVEALTDREREVLSLLAQGLTNKDIAQSLFLSVRTVEAHLRNIYSRLEVTSRTEAALWAVHHGFEP